MACLSHSHPCSSATRSRGRKPLSPAPPAVAGAGTGSRGTRPTCPQPPPTPRAKRSGGGAREEAGPAAGQVLGASSQSLGPQRPLFLSLALITQVLPKLPKAGMCPGRTRHPHGTQAPLPIGPAEPLLPGDRGCVGPALRGAQSQLSPRTRVLPDEARLGFQPQHPPRGLGRGSWAGREMRGPGGLAPVPKVQGPAPSTDPAGWQDRGLCGRLG